MAEKEQAEGLQDDYSVAECVEQAASAYSSYFDVDPRKESQNLEEEIEEMLTKLDEFCAVVDMIRTDTSLALNRSLPEIHAKAKSLEETYRRIDQLEEFVSLLKKNVHTYEDLVNTAEKDLGTLSSIKSLFSSFPLFSKKGAAPKQKKFVAPEIFSTSDYISKSATHQRRMPDNSDR